MTAAAKRTIPQPYRSTSVSAHQTRDQLETLLHRYGITDLLWQSAASGKRRGMALRFCRGSTSYRFVVNLGDTAQTERQRMRALYWGLKAMLEQSEFGILRFEDVFLGYAEVALPNGGSATVADLVGAQLRDQQVPSLEAALRALPARIE